MTLATLLGCGMRTPIGFNRTTSAAAFRAGMSAIAEHSFMVDRFGQPMAVTRDHGLDPSVSGAERLAAMAIPAADEALAPIAGQRANVSILLSFGETRPGLNAGMCTAVSDRLVHALSESIVPTELHHWMGGHAGAIEGIVTGSNLITTGKADYVLVGGIDSYLMQDTLEWLDEIEQLHSERNIYGFCPGEAAGFVLLASPSMAGTGLRIVGTGSGYERNLIKTEDICLGEGLTETFKAATASIAEGRTIDRILCDMNGERYRGNEYGFAILRTAGLFKAAADFESPADCWGDVGAASGPLFAGLAIEAEARGYAKGPLTMIWASSESGRRAAVVIERHGAPDAIAYSG